ncbi:uncharacterized protein HD556DRAFT_1530622 [Suillus plorans]|uniref:Uncharacterized protein n=1 Tax=Suillus plorans TaxID=116603 RepID=A0A9P7ADH5_9AGAM|nr:uncharacterized protein HD556DRAFT_1530622 [Suillus plorans]KAG1787205.1 hypothetical protein HD556DRAFT_1530622 [Suillus plorans]
MLFARAAVVTTVTLTHIDDSLNDWLPSPPSVGGTSSSMSALSRTANLCFLDNPLKLVYLVLIFTIISPLAKSFWLTRSSSTNQTANLPRATLTAAHSLVASTHRISRARDVATKYLFNLITLISCLMCYPPLAYAILEPLTLLRHAGENEFTGEYNPVYEFHSECTSIAPQLTDDYKAFGPVHRQLSSLCSLSNWNSDRARALASQLVSKCYFSGEVTDLRLATYKNQDSLDKVTPQMKCTGVRPFKDKIADTTNDVRHKDLKHLLFRCAVLLRSLEKLYRLRFSPPVAAGIETWIWVIAKCPNMEVAIMCEVLKSWFGTVKERKGVFSASSKFVEILMLHTLSVWVNPTNEAKRRSDPHGLLERTMLEYIIVWAPVALAIAVPFFEQRYGNDPLLLQYGHQVLKQRPVNLTFFFVPQVIQALRFDGLVHLRNRKGRLPPGYGT